MIKRIELENYRCYKSFEKDFTTGLNVIAGQNGTGKTTIVEAIAYALFGNKLTRGKANSWIRNNCKHGKVVLYLNDYTITRGDNEQYVEDSDGVIIARQHVGIDQWVNDTYGFSSELFSTSNYIAQKDIESFSFLQSAERIKRVELLLSEPLFKLPENEQLKKDLESIKGKLEVIETASLVKPSSGDKIQDSKSIAFNVSDFLFIDNLAARIKKLKETIKKDNITEIYANISSSKDAFVKIKTLEKERKVLEKQSSSLSLIYNAFVKVQKEGLENFIYSFSSKINEY